jgi:hypothetical protein
MRMQTTGKPDYTSEAASDADYGLSDEQLVVHRFSLGRQCSRRSQAQSSAADDDDTSEVSDSEYGLSDRQLEDLWLRFRPAEVQVELDAASTPATSSIPGPMASGYKMDSEKDLWSRFRPAEVRVELDAAATPATSSVPGTMASGSKMDSEKESAKQHTSGFCPRRLKRLDQLQSQAVADLGEEEQERRRLAMQEDPLPSNIKTVLTKQVSSRNVKISLISHREVANVTWYAFSVKEPQGEVRYYMKRYNDFTRLDDALREARGATRRKLRLDGLPDLPESGMFGLRQALNIGDFRSRRTEGLGKYAQDLGKNLTALKEDPHLEAFFGVHARGRIFPMGDEEAIANTGSRTA